MGAEQAELLSIPSPACSQSELLPAEIAKVERQGPPVWMEYGVEAEQDDEPVTISDFVVPFFEQSGLREHDDESAFFMVPEMYRSCSVV